MNGFYCYPVQRACVSKEKQGLRALNPGDFVNIPAHTRHRVEWTDEKQSTVWSGPCITQNLTQRDKK